MRTSRFHKKHGRLLHHSLVVVGLIGALFLIALSLRGPSTPPRMMAASVIGCWLGDCNVDVGEYEPACSISVNPSVANPGTPVTLSWSTNMLSPYVTPDLGAVGSGAGTRQIHPLQSTTYTLYDHAGAYGWVRYWLYVILGLSTPTPYCAAMFTASPSPDTPTCELSAFPTSVVSGDPTTLYYTIWGDFTSSQIQGVGQAPMPPVTYTVRPTQDKLYELSVTNAAGTSKCFAPVQVQPAPSGPTLYLEASPLRVAKGKPVIVAWSGKNVASCALTNSHGQTLSQALTNPVPAPTYAITKPTTFTLTCLTSNNTLLTRSVSVGLTPAVTEI